MNVSICLSGITTSANLTDVSSFIPLSPSEIKTTITKNNAVVIRTERPIPATYLLVSKALLYKATIGLNAEFIAVVN